MEGEWIADYGFFAFDVLLVQGKCMRKHKLENRLKWLSSFTAPLWYNKPYFIPKQSFYHMGTSGKSMEI